VENVDAVENSVGGHRRVRVSPSFGIDDRQRFGAPVVWRDRLLDEDGKTIMAHLQQVVVNQQCEAYVLTSRFCMDCERFRRIKDYGKRKIRTVFGRVEVRNPRIMNCQRGLPHFCEAWTVLRDICPDQWTPEIDGARRASG
jgi:hypothetical protein